MKAKFQTVLESRRKMTVATKYVTEANGGCLLSAGTGQELGLITLHLNTMTPNNHPARLPAKDKDVQNVVDKYRKVFQGQGKLQSKQIELIIDQAVKPVAQRQGRIPFHLRAKVEQELTKLQRLFTIYIKHPSGVKLCKWNAKISIGKSRSEHALSISRTIGKNRKYIVQGLELDGNHSKM